MSIDKTHIKVGGSYEEAEKLFGKVSGSYVEGQRAWKKVGGSWVQFYGGAVVIGIPTSFTLSNATDTTLDYSFTAGSNAQEYDIYLNNTYHSTVTSLTGTITGLTEDTSYTGYVIGKGYGEESAASNTDTLSTEEAISYNFKIKGVDVGGGDFGMGKIENIDDLADGLGISTSDITNFTHIPDEDGTMTAIITTDYSITSHNALADAKLTYFEDLGRCIEISGQDIFGTVFSGANTSYVKFTGLLNISDSGTLRYLTNGAEVIIESDVSISGFNTFSDNTNLDIKMPNITTLGSTTGKDNVFSNYGGGGTLTIPLSLHTDGDAVDFVSKGGTLLTPAQYEGNSIYANNFEEGASSVSDWQIPPQVPSPHQPQNPSVDYFRSINASPDASSGGIIITKAHNIPCLYDSIKLELEVRSANPTLGSETIDIALFNPITSEFSDFQNIQIAPDKSKIELYFYKDIDYDCLDQVAIIMNFNGGNPSNPYFEFDNLEIIGIP